MNIARFIYLLGNLGNGFITWMSLAGTLITVFGIFVKQTGKKKANHEHGEEDNKQPVGLIALTVSLILVTLVTYVGQNLVEVPDVVGYLYEDARQVLVEKNLKYSVLVDNGIYVESQEPAAGEIVAPGTVITLTVADTSSSEEAIAFFEKQINATEFGNLELQFYDALVQVRNEAGIIQCFGPDFYNFTVAEAYLLQEDYGIKYCEYSVKDGKLCFPDIPVGVEFTLYVLLDGYEEVKCDDIILSSINMTDNTFLLNLGLTKTGREYMPATSFRIADEAENFLSGVNFQIKFSWEDMWYRDYVSNADGAFPYTFWLSEDQSIAVCVVEPFKNAQDVYCAVTLHKFSAGSIADDAVIIVANDGSCQVVAESDFFGY